MKSKLPTITLGVVIFKSGEKIRNRKTGEKSIIDHVMVRAHQVILVTTAGKEVDSVDVDHC